MLMHLKNLKKKKVSSEVRFLKFFIIGDKFYSNWSEILLEYKQNQTNFNV